MFGKKVIKKLENWLKDVFGFKKEEKKKMSRIINKCFAFKFPAGKVFSDIYNSSPENIWFRNSNF